MIVRYCQRQCWDINPFVAKGSVRHIDARAAAPRHRKGSQRAKGAECCEVLRSAAKCCKGMNYDETCENWVVEVVEGDHVWARCKRQNNLLRQPTAKQSGTAWNSLERSGTHFRSARVSKQACKGPMEPAEYRRRQARGLIERVINCDCMTDMTVRLSMKYCSITAWWNKNK